MLIKSSLPYLRMQGGGRIIQISSYGGQVAFPANSMYHATKFGIEGFCESVAQEVGQFNIGITLVEPVEQEQNLDMAVLKLLILCRNMNHVMDF